MHRAFLLPCLTLLVMFTSPAMGSGDEGAALAEPALSTVVDWDFREIEAAGLPEDATLSGQTNWTSDGLGLNSSAAIQTTLPGSPWTEIRLVLRDWQPRDTVSVRLNVRFRFDAATPCCLRFDRQRVSGTVETTLQVIDTDGEGADAMETVVREASLPLANETALVVSYRQGHVIVSTASGEPLLQAALENGSTSVRSVSLSADEGTLRLQSLRIRQASEEDRELTADEIAKLRESDRTEQLMVASYRSGDFPQAVRLGEDVLRIRKRILGPFHPATASSLNNLAAMADSAADYPRAESLYREALTARKALLGDGHPSCATTMNNLGGLLSQTGNYEHALPLLEQALQIQRHVLGQQHPQFAIGLNNLASLREKAGDYPDAAQGYLEAMAVIEEAFGTDHQNYAVLINNLAGLYEKTGDYADAERLYLQSTDIKRRTVGEEHPSYATSLNNLSTLYGRLGDYAKSVQLLRQAYEIRRRTLGEQHPESLDSLSNLAENYRSTGDIEQSASLMTRVILLTREAFGDDHPRVADSVSNFAGLNFEARNFREAERLYEQVLTIRRAALGRFHPDCLSTMQALAMTRSQLGDHAAAAKLYQEVLSKQQEILAPDHPDLADTLLNFANLLADTGELDSADKHYQRANAIFRANYDENHPRLHTILVNRALLAARRGNEQAAGEFLQRALANATRSLRQSSIVLSERQQKRNRQQRRPILDASLSLAVSGSGNAAEMIESVWQWKGAVTLQQRSYRMVADNETVAPYFQSLQRVTRQLSTLSEQRPVPPPGPVEASTQQALTDARARWQRRFAELTHERERLEQAIAEHSDAYRSVEQPLRIRDVQAHLSERTVLVDFLEYGYFDLRAVEPSATPKEKRYLAFVIRAEGDPTWVDLGSTVEVHSAMTKFRAALSAEGRTDAATADRAAEAAQTLRQRVWEPLEPFLDGIDTVLISPDTELSALPFAALPGSEDGRYLVEEYRLGLLPFVGLLPELNRSSSTDRKPNLLVLGDVEYDASPSSAETTPLPLLARVDSLPPSDYLRGRRRKGWSSLPGFDEEMKIVQSLHRKCLGPGSEQLVIAGQDATEQAFLNSAGGYACLHLVTHGYFDDSGARSIDQAEIELNRLLINSSGTDPFVDRWVPGLLSGLVLAGANRSVDFSAGDDGILRASEIETAALEAVDLVVLSACETGLGAVAGGEGLTGLQRAFHTAGADTVVASLWKVDDRATQELMRRFYTNLWEHDMSKLDALREAQLWMLRHPKELDKMGVKGAATRGDVRPLKPADKQPRASADGRTDPFFWAAFQLSGDWR